MTAVFVKVVKFCDCEIQPVVDVVARVAGWFRLLGGFSSVRDIVQGA